MAISILTEISPEEDRLSKVVGELAATLPNNELGFPIGFYRSDLLPFHDYVPEEAAVQRLFRLPEGMAGKLVHQEDGYKFVVSPDTLESPITTQEGGDLHGQESQVEGDEDEVEEGEDAPDPLDDILDGLSADPDGFENAVQQLEARQQHSKHLTRQGLPTPGAQEVSPPAAANRVAGFRRQDLAAAFVQLSYEEGFPTQPDGRPFWERFEHEPVEAHLCFQAYLQMPNVADGIRSLAGLPLVMESNKLLNLNGLHHEQYTAKFRIYFQMYYWAQRTKAYDYYKIAAYRKAMEHRGNSVQDSQYGLSTRLMAKLSEYMESQDEFWDMMTPKVAIDMFKAITTTQRISAGLPALSPPTEKTSPNSQGHSFEMILRTLATAGVKHEEGKGGQGTTLDGQTGEPLAARILENPALTTLAQELILRLTTHADPVQKG